MGACRELNPYSCWACILMIRKPDDDISAYLAQGYFQDYLKFLERRKLKLMRLRHIQLLKRYSGASTRPCLRRNCGTSIQLFKRYFRSFYPTSSKAANIIVNRP